MRTAAVLLTHWQKNNYKQWKNDSTTKSKNSLTERFVPGLVHGSLLCRAALGERNGAQLIQVRSLLNLSNYCFNLTIQKMIKVHLAFVGSSGSILHLLTRRVDQCSLCSVKVRVQCWSGQREFIILRTFPWNRSATYTHHLGCLCRAWQIIMEYWSRSSHCLMMTALTAKRTMCPHSRNPWSPCVDCLSLFMLRQEYLLWQQIRSLHFLFYEVLC